MTDIPNKGRTPFDLSLYFVVGRENVGDRDLLDVVQAAVRGGVTLVQLREKAANDEELIALAGTLKRVLPSEVPLILNDRAELAAEAGADGVHLGQDDGSPAKARAILGPEAIIGLSAGNLAEAAVSDVREVDYIGVGPVFTTGTKGDAGAAIGPKGVLPVKQALQRPAVAIGGITLAHAAEVIAAGADGIAVVSAIAGAADPEAAARALRQAVEQGRTSRETTPHAETPS